MEDLPVVQNLNNNDPIPANKENLIILASSLLLGWAFDILFHRPLFGISCPIFVLLFYVVFLYNLKPRLSFTMGFGWLLSIPVFMLSFTYFIFSNEIFFALNILVIPVLIVAQTTIITGNNKFSWFETGFVAEIFYSTLNRPLANIFKPFMLLGAIFPKKREWGKYQVIIKILVGLTLSIPLLLIIILLLSSADQVFGHFMGRLPELFKDIDLGQFLFRTGTVVIISVLCFSYFWSMLNRKNLSINALQSSNSLQRRKWDPVTVITILILIDVVYILFTLIQFSYLFGSIKDVLPIGITYSEYARRGFFELIVVTLINLSILLMNLNFTNKESYYCKLVIGMLNVVLVICTGVMLVSAHVRMSMYEEIYGYTYLRVLTHAFMVFIFVLLVAALVKIWKEKTPLIKSYIILTLLFYVVINYINIDVIIARNNIERYDKTEEIDVPYLMGLSYDAVPYLVKLTRDKNQNVALEAEKYLVEKKSRLQRDKAWQSFNISEYLAEKAITEIEIEKDKN